MIPAISPPTDNLYKLISLFGLGIFILGVVNSTKQSEEILESKIEIEYVEKQIVDTIYYYNGLNENEEIPFINTSKNEEVADLIDEISKQGALVHNNKIPPKVANYVDTEVDIIIVKLLDIKKREGLNYLVIYFSVLLMLVGFILWYIKEQRWQDKKLKTDNSN